MRRRVLVAFAVVASLLAVTAMPVSASHTLAVASSHTTDTDFNAGTLTNMTVSGSGTTADVVLEKQSLPATNGTTADRPDDIQSTTSSAKHGLLVEPQKPLVGVRVNLSAFTDTPTTLYVQHPNGTVINSTSWSGTQETILADLKANTEYEVVVDDGGATFTIGSKGGLTFPFSSSDINITAGITGGTEDTSEAFALANVTALIGGPADTSSYISQNHTVENSEQGFVNITEITNATATVTWETNGGSGWSTLNQTSGITTAGNHTFTWPVETNDTVRVNVTVFNQSINGEPIFKLADEGVQFTANETGVDNGSANPTGELNTATPTLEIDINDSDFATAQGDTVDVEFFVDGSSVGTDTLTSNGTVSVTVSNALTGGDHTWNVTASDDYGHSTKSQTFDISTPGNITIRDEQNASRLIDDAQVNITAYFSGQIIRRTSSDGTVDISGFPVDEPIIVRASADGYYTRTIVIEDIFQQQSIYLLNDSVATYQVRFDLEDPTGQYPRSETVLFVDRDINLSGSVEWRVIAGDEFGIEGVPVDLVQGERFRIRIKNLETGTTAILGKYTAIQSETVVLSPKSPTFDFGDIERAYTWEARENETSQKIIVEYAEENSSKKADVKITIHERFNESNVLVDNQTFTDTNSVLFDQPLTANQVNKTWSLVLYVDRGDGYMRFGPEAIGSGAEDLIPGDLDEVWRASVGVFLLLISSMAFSELNRGVGAIATSLVGGVLWWIGLLGTVAIGPAVVFAIGVSVAYKYRLRGNA